MSRAHDGDHTNVDVLAARYAAQLENLFTRGARKNSGSYYTPNELVECLLDSALQPLIDERLTAPTPASRINRLFDLSICDPACGAGAFLTAAARRVARHVAQQAALLAGEDRRTWCGLPDPSPETAARALRAVTATCIHGVDLSEMAAELCKVALWLQAADPDRPHAFLDARIRVGNALLGTTPTLLAGGIPDAAFATLEGDDPKVVAELRRRNAHERAAATAGIAQEGLF